MTLWICHEYTYDGCNDHEDQQVTVQVVTRLQQLHTGATDAIRM